MQNPYEMDLNISRQTSDTFSKTIYDINNLTVSSTGKIINYKKSRNYINSFIGEKRRKIDHQHNIVNNKRKFEEVT